MTLLRSWWVRAGLVVLLAAAVWQAAVANRWSRRLVAGWSWAAVQIGTFTRPDPETNRLGERETPALYERRLEVMGPGNAPNTVILEERFTVWDVDGTVRWQALTQSSVDPRTGLHAEGDHQGQAAVFPRRVHQTTYRFHAGHLNSIPLAFQREEAIEGLPTYLFAYKGRAEYTGVYTGTDDFIPSHGSPAEERESPKGDSPKPGALARGAGFTGIAVKSWQEIRCADDQFAIQVWVEPLTGEVVKLDERCPSGDYVYETTTDLPVFPVARWGGVTAGDEVLARVSALQRLRRRHAWETRAVPWGLWLGGVGLIGIGLLVGSGWVRWLPRPAASAGAP